MVLISDLSVLDPGDHIYVYRTGYCHHGINVGDGAVVEFSGDNSTDWSSFTIRETTLLEFADSKDVHRVEYVPHETFCEVLGNADAIMVGIPSSRERIVARAFKAIGLTDSPWDHKYNLVTNNCDAFAYWCVTGKMSLSNQFMKRLNLFAAPSNLVAHAWESTKWLLSSSSKKRRTQENQIRRLKEKDERHGHSRRVRAHRQLIPPPKKNPSR